MPVRLRVAGGTLASEWVPIRFERGGQGPQFHAIVEDEHWNGRLHMDTAVIVDVGNLTEAEMSTLHDWLHRLMDGRGPMSEAETQDAHDAIQAHLEGLDDSKDVADRRAAQASQGLEAKFKDVDDMDLLERAADGDTEAQQERNRRKVMARTQPAKPAPAAPAVQLQGKAEATVKDPAPAEQEAAPAEA